MYRKVFDLVRSLFLLYLMLHFGELIAHYVPIGIPSSIWGLLLLFSSKQQDHGVDQDI